MIWVAFLPFWLKQQIYLCMYAFFRNIPIFSSEGFVISTFRQTLHLTTLKINY